MTAPSPIPTPEELQFFAEAANVHGVLGNEHCFVFVPFGDPAVFAEASQQAAHRGLWFCGSIGQSNVGDPLILCEPDADSIRIMARALAAYLRQHMRTARALATEEAGVGDGPEWLHRLFALDDPRHGPN